jgi:hypothetical protein
MKSRSSCFHFVVSKRQLLLCIALSKDFTSHTRMFLGIGV